MGSQRVRHDWTTSLSLLSLAQPSASLWSSLRLGWISYGYGSLKEFGNPKETERTHHGKPAFLKPFLFCLSATLHLIWIKDQELEYKQTENKVCRTEIKIHILEWCWDLCVLRIGIPGLCPPGTSAGSWQMSGWNDRWSTRVYFCEGLEFLTNAWDPQ